MKKRGGLLLLCVLTWQLSAEVLVDPTRPQKYSKKMVTEGENSALVVSAIFISEAGKQAIINGKSVQEGQIVAGYTVRAISVNKVELSGPQGSQSLFVNNNNIKKDSNNGF